MRAAFSLTTWESKRLIGRAVARMPEVVHALAHAEIMISHGTTDVYVAEEILGHCPARERFVSGQIINGTLCATAPEEKPRMIRIARGEIVPPAPGDLTATLKDWDASCIFIKGANAVDPEFNAGIFNAHPGAGTIGFAYGYICGLGITLVVPVGLEKLVPSVKAAANLLGHTRVDYFSGLKIGMTPLINARVVTEIQACEILFGLPATHVGGGGVGGSEGSVVIVVDGEDAAVEAAIAEINTIKGEPPLATKKAWCASCVPSTPSTDVSARAQFVGHGAKQCIFEGLAEPELPEWFAPSPHRHRGGLAGNIILRDARSAGSSG